MRWRMAAVLLAAWLIPWSALNAEQRLIKYGTGSEETRPVLAVVGGDDFLPDRTGLSGAANVGLPNVLVERIGEHLTRSRRFVVAERQALRRAVVEQRFGQATQPRDLERVVDRAIEVLDVLEGGYLSGAPTGGQLALPIPGAVGPIEPRPVGGGIGSAGGAAGVTGALADYSDVLRDFLDLGRAVGAQYLVLGNLEQIRERSNVIQVPYSVEGRVAREDLADVRLRLRLVDVENGTIAGASSFETQIVWNTLGSTTTHDPDALTIFDEVGRIAALKVLDMAYPAVIAEVEPLLLTRGANDGVSEGDVYQVVRDGRPVSDQSGQVLAYLEEPVGRVQVQLTQDTISRLQILEGGPFRQGDRAVATLDPSIPAARSRTAAPALRPPPPGASPEPAAEAVAASPQRLPRLAVGLIKSQSTAEAGPEETISIFTDSLISRLVQTRRFQVADRQEIDQLLAEQTLEALGEHRGLMSAVGSIEAVDYLVYGNLSLFAVDVEERQLPGSSRILPSNPVGRVEGNMRIVDMRSSDVIESRKISVEERLDSGLTGERTVDVLADAYAHQVVVMLMDALYPIRIAAIGSEGTIYINRGDDGGLFVGEMLDVYRPEGEIRDPDTGIILGVEERFLGQVVLAQVEDSRSRGQQASGHALRNGDLLRRQAEQRGQRAAVRPERAEPALSGARLGATPRSTVDGSPATDRFVLAVGSLSTSRAGQYDMPPDALIDRATNDLLVKLSNTQRFLVLDRQEVDQLIDEKAFATVASGDAFDPRLRQLLGSDYLVLGQLDNLYSTTSQRHIAALNTTEVRTRAVAEGTLRITDVATGALIAAEKVKVERETRGEEDRRRVSSELIDSFTNEAVQLVLGRLFPMRVLGLAGDGTLYINRGLDGGIKVADVFDVLRPGAVLVDPDTGLTFGASETTVGRVEVISVESSRARARIVSNQDALLAGDVLRAPAQVPVQQPQRARPRW
jgi:curli biogenesis system outer membrane secretion channel CsgG